MRKKKSQVSEPNSSTPSGKGGKVPVSPPASIVSQTAKPVVQKEGDKRIKFEKFPMMMYQQGLDPIVIHSEREYLTRLEAGWTGAPLPLPPSSHAKKEAKVKPIGRAQYPPVNF